MKGIFVSLVGVALGAAACGDAKLETIQPGETARGLSVSYYTIERTEDAHIIHIFATVGPNGAKNYHFGDVIMTSAKVGEIGFEGATLTEADLERDPLIRVLWQEVNGYTENALFRGREYEGLECPQERNPLMLPVKRPWHAAMTDKALAPFLAELRLEMIEAERNLVMDPERAFDGYPHVGNCSGHRVLPHSSGYPYQSCYQYPQFDDQMVYNYNSSPGPYCTGFRDCWGGAAQGGNGKGSTNCCNSNCSHPSPGGNSTQTDCAGFSANGCKFTGDACGCDGPCQYFCTDYCGGYDASCC